MRMSLVLGILFLPMIFYGDPTEELQKVYIQPTQLAFADQSMFAYIAEEWISVNAVYADAQGLYVLEKNPYHSRWICSECGYNNNGWDKTCQRDYPNGQKCGRLRPW